MELVSVKLWVGETPTNPNAGGRVNSTNYHLFNFTLNCYNTETSGQLYNETTPNFVLQRR